jgi:hypothetical protein
MLIERSDQSKKILEKSLLSLISPSNGPLSFKEQFFARTRKGTSELHGHFLQLECLSFMDAEYRYYGISVCSIAPRHTKHFACLPAKRPPADTSYPQTSYSTLTKAS